MKLLYGERYGSDLLHKFCADQRGNVAAARASDEHATVVRCDAGFRLHAIQELKNFFRLFGFMPLVVGPNHLVGSGIDDDRFHCRRAHIHADVVRQFGLAERHRIAPRFWLRTRKSCDQFSELYVELDCIARAAAIAVIMVP